MQTAGVLCTGANACVDLSREAMAACNHALGLLLLITAECRRMSERSPCRPGRRGAHLGEEIAAALDVGDSLHLHDQQPLRLGGLPAPRHDVKGHAIGVAQQVPQHLQPAAQGTIHRQKQPASFPLFMASQHCMCVFLGYPRRQ